MKQIKKLARRGMARTLALLTAIFFGVAAVFGLIMLGEGVKQALLMAVTMIVMFGFILLIFVLIGSVPYLRVGKMVIHSFPYTTLFRSSEGRRVGKECKIGRASCRERV